MIEKRDDSGVAIKQTLGEAVADLLTKDDQFQDLRDTEKEIHKNFDEEMFQCMADCRTLWDDECFIEVITNPVKAVALTIRRRFNGRKTCPTPEFGRSVYHYDIKNKKLEFLWVVPLKNTCLHLLYYKDDLVKDYDALMYDIMRFYNGDLLKLAKQYNKETGDITDNLILINEG